MSTLQNELLASFATFCNNLGILFDKNDSEAVLSAKISHMCVIVSVDVSKRSICFVEYGVQERTKSFEHHREFTLDLNGVGSSDQKHRIDGFQHSDIIVEAVLQNMIMNITANMEQYQFQHDRTESGRKTGEPHFGRIWSTQDQSRSRVITPVIDMTMFLADTLPAGRWSST